MIYFIQDAASGLIKIGFSETPRRRLSELQVARTDRLRLLGVVDGSRRDERALHSRFVRQRGEWFTPTDDLITYISLNASPVDITQTGRGSNRQVGAPALPGAGRPATKAVIHNGQSLIVFHTYAGATTELGSGIAAVQKTSNGLLITLTQADGSEIKICLLTNT